MKTTHGEVGGDTGAAPALCFVLVAAPPCRTASMHGTYHADDTSRAQAPHMRRTGAVVCRRAAALQTTIA